MKPTAAIDQKGLLEIFSKIDSVLQKKKQNLTLITLGGASIILLKIRDRVTMDIDIASNQDAVLFEKICNELGFPVDIITQTSTVDFENEPKIDIFKGKALQVKSITPQNLIKSKLERFYKQDPEDIYATIKKIKLSYESFKALVQEMIPYFIGNPRTLLLSALIVVQTMYADNEADFKKAFSIS